MKRRREFQEKKKRRNYKRVRPGGIVIFIDVSTTPKLLHESGLLYVLRERFLDVT